MYAENENQAEWHHGNSVSAHSVCALRRFLFPVPCVTAVTGNSNHEDNHSLLDINIEKLKNDLTNKNDGLNDKNFNNNNGYQKNLINGDIMNNNNMKANLMLINQMNQINQQKFIFPHNINELNSYNGSVNYMNKMNYNQSPNNGYNMNFSNIYKNS